MKMDFLDRGPMDLCLRLAQPGEDPHGQVFLGRGQRAAIDHLRDVVKVPVGMFGLVFDRDAGCPHSLLRDFGCNEPAAGESQRVDACLDLFQRNPSIHERTESHVTTDATDAVQVCNFHRCSFHLRLVVSPWPIQYNRLV